MFMFTFECVPKFEYFMKKLDRKEFIKTVAVSAGAVIVPIPKSVQAGILQNASFTLPPLTYPYKALEPYMDAQTMEIHHTKHHQAYITKLNEVLDKEPSLKGLSLEKMLDAYTQLPISDSSKTIIRNNGGGHWNHSFFWPLLKTGTTPGGKLNEALLSVFGSMENFKNTFEKAALGQFGSGWAWLIDTGKTLQVVSTANQDNPIMQGQVKGKPILALDVWEHAYYLKYQNKRADYAKAFWQVLNWEQAEKNFLQK
jgi:Fe-Mn family superoxide dismutase